MSFIIQRGTWIWKTRWFPWILQTNDHLLNKGNSEALWTKTHSVLKGQPFLQGFSIFLPANNKILILFWNKWKVFHWFKSWSYQKGTSLFKRPKENYWTVWKFKNYMWTQQQQQQKLQMYYLLFLNWIFQAWHIKFSCLL